MDREYYLKLADSGIRMPIGADLVLREKEDSEKILFDGEQLGNVLEETARRYKTPLAFPLMDLTLEKATLLDILEVQTPDPAKFHFAECPGDEILAALDRRIDKSFGTRMRASLDAIHHVATKTELFPVGMAIGPFSLMSKLLSDPIVPVFLAGTGVTAEDDPEVRSVERLLEMGTKIILRSIRAQVDAGARAVCIAEPAANKVYVSPNQIEEGSDVYERLVMKYMRRVKAELDRAGADLIFHCCGELIPYMLRQFTTLDAAILSLGSSRKLWEDAQIVPKRTVLFGNLPSKQFYSDSLITSEQVKKLSREIVQAMRKAEHPFILASECDVLSVPGCEHTIREKVDAFVHDPRD